VKLRGWVGSRVRTSAALGFAFEVGDGGWNQQRGKRWKLELVAQCCNVGAPICGENLEPFECDLSRPNWRLPVGGFCAGGEGMLEFEGVESSFACSFRRPFGQKRFQSLP